ncbi:MAG TPA: cytochrome c3 family protein [Draconibacterium sp.]|nr:cytochrome c3 family protein [Draconibacterium sp.]
MKLRFFLVLYIITGIPAFVFAQSIINSKHNLSVSGPGSLKSTSESEICIFCHTPHNSNPQVPLWNRNNSIYPYTIYNNSVSSTFNATTGQPDGSSLVCLSCHDGTIALGNVLSRSTDIFDGNGTKMPAGSRGLVGTDLSDDHPVSFVFNSSLASGDGHLKYPPVYPATLDENSKLQCTSCHNAHNNMYGKFLVASKEFSDICLKCHDYNYWSNSTHRTSSANWNGSGTNPWAHIETPYSSVSQNACANCHESHNANGRARLMKSSLEENNCLDCHNGNVANSAKNIATDFAKPYKHNVTGYNQIHIPNESVLVSSKHVECQDCHNPHASKGTTANAPNANGTLAGVAGINQSGIAVNPISFEYELCYRCHAENSLSASLTSRQISQNNTRLEFDLNSISYHPVAGIGKNTSAPSLIAPYTVSSIIYCTDCHASNGANSPAGPHGSIYPAILKYQYLKADNTAESAQNYALCYSCHSRTSILGNASFKEHDKHIAGEDTPCNACHDPHGISNSQGNVMYNTNLINFDLSIVTPSSSGILRFEDTGNRTGRCYLTCHGENHNPLSYKP